MAPRWRCGDNVDQEVAGVFEIACERSFCATHYLVKDGRPLEPRHGHDWRVEAVAGAAGLDEAGLVLDFEQLREALERVASRFHYKELNDHPDLGEVSPSAEVVARYFFREIRKALGERGGQLLRVRVYEAPGCSATYAEG
jgi:6-pyruvoyltetrahydropterin/6-carboxytetrahydropterin synthase